MIETPTYDELKHRVQWLETGMDRIKRFQKISHALFKISNSLNTMGDLYAFYGSIHKALGTIVDASNFYIALYARSSDSITFPYCVDSVDDRYPPVIDVSKTASLTAEVIRTGRPLLIRKEDMNARRAKTRCKIPACTPSEVWLGVPLRTGDGIIGVMAVQSYTDPHRYDQTDIDVMASVADQVAVVIQRKRAETGLRESEEKFRLAFHTSPDSINLNRFDDGVYIDINDGFTKILGYTRDEVIDKSSLSLNIWENPEDRQRLVEGLKASGDVENLEARFVGKDGLIRWGLMSARVIQVNGENLIISITRDITDRKRAEEDRDRLISAMEQAGEVFVITDEKGGIQYVNPAFERITGYTQDEAVGKNPRILKSGVQDGDFYRSMWDTLTRGGVWRGRIVNRRKDGALYTEEATISPVCDSAGKITNFIAVKRDITEAIKLENQLRQAQKVDSIGRLAGGVAHDLNNLLSPILGYSEMLLDDLGANDARRAYAGEVLRAGYRSRDLVKQLLAFSRKQTLEYRPMDLNQILSDFEKLLYRTIPEDVRIHLALSSGIGTVMADIGQIEQVIMNLVVNAADAMANGGTLTIETEMAVLDDRYAAGHPGVTPGTFVLLAISDTGCGMDEETRNNIFEPFFSTKGEQGTGLGLATVYGIVKQHDGNIWVYSEPGKGTTFKVYLPVAGKAAADERFEAKNVMEIKGSETVLLVEDNAQVRHLAHAILKQKGYHVLVEKDGADALAALAAHEGPVDLLLSDVVMPGMNGRELYDNVVERHPGMKVLYMSGYSTNVVAHRGVLDEGVQFIQKPFTVQGLALKVREVLDNAKVPA
jgi:two-component system, cell cycle sensor histidine kinase and response regulator CckA